MSRLKTELFTVKYGSCCYIRCKRNTFIEKYIPPEFFVMYYDPGKDIGCVFNPVVYAITGKKRLTYLRGFREIKNMKNYFTRILS